MAKLLVKNGEAIIVDGQVLLATEAEPELQAKSASYTPTESQQTDTITPDTGYDGLSQVSVTVGAIASDYVASGITRRSSSDLTVSGATVTAPAGYYSADASQSVATMTLPSAPTTTSSGTSKATISRSTSTRYLNIPAGYNSTAQYYTISAVPNGSATTPATTITANPSISVGSDGKITATASASQNVTPTVSAGYVSNGTAGAITVSGSSTEQLDVQTAITITPTESQQTAVAAGKYTTGAVTVGAISSTYVGSGIDRNDSTDLNVVGATVQVPNGYYAENASATVASGTAGTPTATKGTVSNHSVSVTPSVTNTTGYITGGTKNGTAVTVSASELVSGNRAITANGTGIDVTNYATVSVAVDDAPTLQAKSVDPTESQQVVTPDTGYDGLSQVTVGAIASDYVASGITRRSSSDLTVSGATVTAPAGYYSASASKSVASGTAGTPTATKGSVSNHAISVTPSVTNTTGYITGGTKNGTAVTVAASELVSGTLTVTTNNTYDVTNYASVDVNVAGGGGGSVIIEDTTDEHGGTIRTITATDVVMVQSKTVTPTTSQQVVSPDSGYDALSQVTVEAMPAGSVTSPSTISGTAASVSTGTNTLTLTKTVSVTPTVSTAGYVSAGTAGNSSVSLTASVTTKAAATITPGTTAQTIASGTYLTGTQTIAGDADLVGSNILSTANIFGVQGTVTFSTYYTGTSDPASSLGSDGDIYLKTGA